MFGDGDHFLENNEEEKVLEKLVDHNMSHQHDMTANVVFGGTLMSDNNSKILIPFDKMFMRQP